MFKNWNDCPEIFFFSLNSGIFCQKFLKQTLNLKLRGYIFSTLIFNIFPIFYSPSIQSQYTYNTKSSNNHQNAPRMHDLTRAHQVLGIRIPNFLILSYNSSIQHLTLGIYKPRLLYQGVTPHFRGVPLTTVNLRKTCVSHIMRPMHE